MKIDTTFVFDTNVSISAHLVPDTVSDKAYKRALALGSVAVSEATLLEFARVVYRKKFDKYIDDVRRELVINQIENNAVIFSTTERVDASSDADDNIFLELAVAAKAVCIISGDQHLLTLHPFRGIPILTPADFLKTF